jgi:hypothetical protein
LLGYAGSPPDPRWPGAARVAVSIVVNFEEGAEFSVTDGDPENEAVYEIEQRLAGRPDPAIDSHFEGLVKFTFWTPGWVASRSEILEVSDRQSRPDFALQLFNLTTPLVRIHDDVGGIEQPRLGQIGDRAASQIGGVIRGCLKGNRCVAATQAYRCALPELRLASLHHSSAFQSDRQRIPMRYPTVRPNPNIGPNIGLWR